MVQATDLTLSPNISGLAQRLEINSILQAMATQHSGASRPAYLPAKSIWTKILSSTLNEIYFYDGISDVLMGGVNSTTGQFTPSGQLAGFANSSDNKTANYTLASTDNGKIITLNSVAAPFTLTVQSWATLPIGWFCILQKTDSSTNGITIDPNGTETVNGLTTISVNTQYQAVILIRLSVTNTFSALLLPNFTLYATLESPALTGVPTAPTPAVGTNTTQIATTAFVRANSGSTIVRTQVFGTAGSFTYTPNANLVFSEVLLVGGGGAGSGSGGAGNAGGISTFGSTLLQAPGGNGATGANGGQGGIPATAGALNIEGGPGGNGGAGRSGNGGDSAYSGWGGRSQIVTGTGGTLSESGKVYGGGGSGQGGNTGGIFYGGGGAGAYSVLSFTASQIGASKAVVVGAGGTGGGGAGANGICFITEYCYA